MITSAFQDVENRHIQEFLDHEVNLLKLVNLADVESLLNVQEVVRDLSDRLKVFEDEHQHKRLVDWVSSINVYAIHQDNLDKHLAGTGQWLLDHPEYRKWKTISSSSTFVLHGIPGCGKTTLASLVIQDFLTKRNNISVTEPFAYFYCADYETEKGRGQPREILRSIVRQLTMSGRPRPEVRQILSSEYERVQAKCKVDGIDMTQPGVEDCERLILNITVDDPVTIVIDALDEIKDADRYELLDVLNQIATKSQNLVKIFLTSRDHSGTLEAITRAIKVRVSSKETRKDMDQFIRHMMNGPKGQGKLLKKQTSEEEKMIQVLLNEAGEM